MSQENVDMVRRAYEAYNRGDIDGGLRTSAPTAGTPPPERSPTVLASFTDARATRSSSGGCEASSTTLKPRSTS